MLVLTRAPGETIIINGNIRVTVVSIRGSQIRIGVEAPSEVTVNREEIQQRVDAGIPWEPRTITSIT
jgi:carbon storage regulator